MSWSKSEETSLITCTNIHMTKSIHTSIHAQLCPPTYSQLIKDITKWYHLQFCPHFSAFHSPLLFFPSPHHIYKFAAKTNIPAATIAPINELVPIFAAPDVVLMLGDAGAEVLEPEAPAEEAAEGSGMPEVNGAEETVEAPE